MTDKRFTSMYNEQSDMIQYVDTLKEEPNKWSICNVSETLKKLNELHEENKKLKQVNEMLQMDLAMTERNLIEENEQLKSDMRDNYKKHKELLDENEHIKQTIQDMMETERTELGRSILRQLWEAIQ